MTAERLLIILPTPEPKELLNRLKGKFPSVEVTFVQSGTSNSAGWGKDEPDKGMEPRAIRLWMGG